MELEISGQDWLAAIAIGALVIIGIVMIGGIKYEKGRLTVDFRGIRAGQEVLRRL